MSNEQSSVAKLKYVIEAIVITRTTFVSIEVQTELNLIVTLKLP